eukprot:g24241.t1
MRFFFCVFTKAHSNLCKLMMNFKKDHTCSTRRQVLGFWSAKNFEVLHFKLFRLRTGLLKIPIPDEVFKFGHRS